MIPDLWRVGREQDGQSSVYYADLWLGRLNIHDIPMQIEEWNEHPHYKMYPALFNAGALTANHNEELGIRLLVKQGLIASDTALSIQPKIKAWLKRTGLFEERPEPVKGEVSFNSIEYRRVDGYWHFYDGTNWTPLKRKANFKSAWEARTQYAIGQASLHDIAEYSWGVVLEVVGDILYKNDIEGVDIDSLEQQVASEIQQIQAEEPILVGFTRCGNLWTTQYNIKPLTHIKMKLFWGLFKKVFAGEMSGYAAHLRFINALPKKIKREDTRWQYNGSLYCPLLIGRQAIIDNCLTLGEARDYVQKIFLAARAIGFILPDERKIYFYYKGNRFGLWLDSGKIFFFGDDSSRYIPKDFDKWSEKKKRTYLGEDYDTEVEKWEKRARLARRLYYYLQHEGLTPKQAWYISRRKHQKLAEDYLRRVRSAGRWSCYHANKTAKGAVEVLGGNI